MSAELDRLNEAAIWDFEIASHEDATLLVYGSNDFTYRHNVEITFHDVTSSNLPPRFSHAIFKFDEDRGIAYVDSEGSLYRICASGVTVRWETKSYVSTKP